MDNKGYKTVYEGEIKEILKAAFEQEFGVKVTAVEFSVDLDREVESVVFAYELPKVKNS